MSFADNLRGMAAQKRQADQSAEAARLAQIEKSWPLVTEYFYKNIKCWCVIHAKNGDTGLSYSFSKFIRQFHDDSSSFDTYNRFVEETDWKLTWENFLLLQNFNKVYHGLLPERYAEDCVHQITALIQADGLHVRAWTVGVKGSYYFDVGLDISW